MTVAYKALGLMSGTSLDAIDLALIETDGFGFMRPLGQASFALEANLVADIRAMCRRAASMNWATNWAEDAAVFDLSERITDAHMAAISAFRADCGMTIDMIGFHGQTVWHDPANAVTVQLGNGQRMADLCGIMVVDQFRLNDVEHGGQGAPLVPLFHAALCAELAGAVAVVNIGGVANITRLEAVHAHANDRKISAFDTGPGNALINDWMLAHTGDDCDRNGEYAQRGVVDQDLVSHWLDDPYFKRPPPKSLDRNHFDVATDLRGRSIEDGAATLSAFTIASLGAALSQIENLEHVIICGGGRHNPFLMRGLQELIAAPVRPCEAYGWDGDHLEAQAFGWLAVRRFLGEVISLPSTTGVRRPLTGGVIHDAKPRQATGQSGRDERER